MAAGVLSSRKWPGTRALTQQEAAEAARGIELLRTFGTELGMPHVRPLRGGLYEPRLHG